MSDVFRVVYSPAVRTALGELIAHASREDEERGRRALAAVRAIDQRLRATARIFGERRFRLRELLEVRVGLIAPLSASFAVHEDQQLVFVTGFRLLGR